MRASLLRVVQAVQVVLEGEIAMRGGTKRGTGWYRRSCPMLLVHVVPLTGTASDGVLSLCSTTGTARTTSQNRLTQNGQRV